MRVCIQKVKESSVLVGGEIVGAIGIGLNVLVGFCEHDNLDTIKYMAKKIANLRIFEDENGIMNKSVLDVRGHILCISQFTLYGDATKGNRPSYIKALNGDKAKPLYEQFVDELNKYTHTETGIFGADMEVNIKNDGPTTIIIEK